MDLDDPLIAVPVAVNVLHDRRLARLRDDSDRAGVILGIAGDGAAMRQGVTRGRIAAVRLPGGEIGQADTTVRHIDHIERVGQ